MVPYDAFFSLIYSHQGFTDSKHFISKYYHQGYTPPLAGDTLI